MLSEGELQQSAVVANASMNRGRGLLGRNSYERELRFSPLDFLRRQQRRSQAVCWLDLCCGTGQALIDAARLLAAEGREGDYKILGVDLVPMFARSHGVPRVRLVEASVQSFDPGRSCDLITCVHGLHYLGDKLMAISNAIRWLAPGGLFAAHLDLANLRLAGGASMSRPLLKQLRESGIDYNRSTRLLTCRGPRELRLPFRFLGADDKAGPNFTQQPAVNSCYAPLR
jgi:SAM-dependent methyltransferase